MHMNVQQTMKQLYHNHHLISTMLASVHTSTKHAMCMPCKCACLLFTMHHTVPQWATLHQPKSEGKEVANCKEQMSNDTLQLFSKDTLPCKMQLIDPEAKASPLWCAFQILH